MAYEIYSYGNGEVLKNVFDAIAMCLNSKTGSLHEPLIRLGLIVGAFWSLVATFYSDISKIFTSWIIPMTVTMVMLFVPTATVHIHDPVSRFHGSVDHVPYGLAAFSGYVSKIGYGITEQVEKVFTLPDDLKYQKTGHVFASNILEKANQFRITNEDMIENMNEFVGQCVLYDALLGRKYTIKDLRHSGDIWGLVSATASPVRSFMWREPRGENGQGGHASPITCQQGVQKINLLWSKEILESAALMGKKIFGTGGLIDGRAEIMKYLPLAYESLGKFSKDASSLIKQQMMISALIDSADKQSVLSGNASNFAAKRAYLSQRATYQTIGIMAGDTLPVMKAVLEAIAYSLFIFVIPLALLPFGWRILSSWAQIILWLQMWAPLYAMLNYIMTIAASSKTLAAMSISTEAGVTIANSVGIMDANADISVMAGYLSMSIPFLSIALVKGLGSFVNLASHLGNVTQGAASMASGELTSGNYSFGNISEGGKSIGNTQMLNQSMSASYRSGAFQFSDGRMDLTTMADSSQVMNVGSSNLPVSLNVAEAQSNQLTQMSSESYQKGLTHSESSAQNLASSYRNMVDLSETIGKSESAGDSINQGTSSEQTKGIQKSAQLVKAFSDQKGISVDKAASLFAEASAGGGMMIFKGSGGARGSINSSDNHLLQEAQNFTQQEDFQEATRSAAQEARNLSHSSSDENTRRLAEGISGSYEQGQQERSEASKSFNQAESYSNQAALTQSNSSSINANYSQQFVEWLADQPADGTTGRLGNHTAAHIIANDPNSTRMYANKFMEQNHLVPSSSVKQSPNSIRSSYDHDSGHKDYLVTRDSMDNVRYQGEQEIGSLDKLEGAPNLRENVETNLHDRSNQIKSKTSELQESGEHNVQKKVKSEQQNSVVMRPLKKGLEEVTNLGSDMRNFIQGDSGISNK